MDRFWLQSYTYFSCSVAIAAAQRSTSNAGEQVMVLGLRARGFGIKMPSGLLRCSSDFRRFGNRSPKRAAPIRRVKLRAVCVAAIA
jgi:hypothetical protein